MTRYRDQYRIESTRLPGWDYTSAAHYYVTLCTKNQQCFFGDVVERMMHLSPIGEIVAEEWQKTPLVRRNVMVDHYVVMPNHLHGIIVIVETPLGVGASPTEAPNVARSSAVETSRRDVSTVPSGVKSGSLGAIIGQIKSVCTKRIWASGSRDFAWQPRFYDHAIRDDPSLNRIRQYIADNPAKWGEDRYHPAKLAPQ